MSTKTDATGAMDAEQAAGFARARISRRTALRAAVAGGAVVYAAPLIDTLTGSDVAHAASVGMVPFYYLSTNCTGKGPAALYPGANQNSASDRSGMLTINTTCPNTSVDVKDNSASVEYTGMAVGSTKFGGSGTGREVTFQTSNGSVSCDIKITNVGNGGCNTDPTTQKISITCTDNNDLSTVYQRSPTALTGGSPVVQVSC